MVTGQSTAPLAFDLRSCAYVVGRLNYANRKIEGERLAITVKKVSLVKKEASWDLMRQDLLKRINSKSYLARDSPTDLSLSRKRIGPHLDIICDGLLESISASAIRLGQLHLDDNDLTIETLPSLSRIIRAARHDLRICDLKNNKLSVRSSEELGLWLDLLKALSICQELHTLDLSGNPLGDKAIEYLTMIYCQEGTYQEHNATGDTVLFASTPMLAQLHTPEFEIVYKPEYEPSGSDLGPESSNRSSNHGSPGMGRSDTLASPTASSCSFLRPSGGFRGLSCLHLENTRMSDAGALSLSYIVEHCYGSDISPFPSPDRAKINPRAFPNENQELPQQPGNGVKYSGNEFSLPGKRLLEAAENSKEDVPECDSDSSTRSWGRRRSSTTAVSRTHAHRRTSGASDSHVRSTTGHSSTVELDRARTKMQGILIKDDRQLLLELWKVALQVLTAMRVFCSTASSNLPYHLPIRLWHRIIVEAFDVHGLLSGQQRSAILRWAEAGEGADSEHDSDYKLNHIKTWKTLQAMQCLAYEWVE